MNPSRTPFRAESIGWMGVEDEGRGTVDGLTFKARNGTDAKNVLFALLKKSLFLGCHGYLHAIRLWTLVHDCHYSLSTAKSFRESLGLTWGMRVNPKTNFF